MKALLGMCVVAVVLALGTQTAEAKIFIINTGEDVVEVGQIKPELLPDVQAETASDVKLGMMYSRFGLFWLDIWRWDKKYVFFSSNTYWEITEEQAKEAAVGLDVPFTMTIPPGLLVLLGITALVVLVKVLGRGKGPDDAPAPEPDTP
ncbi:MAG: hypothetical protein AB7T06_18750 [Kofleriaceae bacterium]